MSVHGKAVDAAADRFTDKKGLGGGGEFKIRAAHRFPVKGDGWEVEGGKEIKAMFGPLKCLSAPATSPS